MEIQYRPQNRLLMIEVHPNIQRSALSNLFLRDFGSRLSPTAVFRDPVGNKFNISVETEGDNKYFATGIRGMMHYYGLDDGGWVSLCYVGATEFEIIRVLDQEQNERSYPTPPISFDIGWEMAKQQPLDYSSEPEFSNFERFHYTEVDLQGSNITANSKVLPAEIVKAALLPIKPTYCVLRDQKNRRFYCQLSWSTRRETECTLKKGWKKFVKANNLTDKHVVWFRIHKDDPHVIHVGVVNELIL